MDDDVFLRIKDCGIVPVIKLESPDQALPLGRALLAGGLPVAEVTFRTSAAAEAIRILRKEYPSLIVGAGTVLSAAQADEALASGACFAVAPGLNPRVVEHCRSVGLPILPGVNSPSQIEAGLELGLHRFKFFPAEASGGVKMLKALHGPYGEVEFVPTGGVDESNLAQYLSLGYVAAVGGSWMVAEKLISTGAFDEVSRLCGLAVSAASAARNSRKM